MGELSEKNATVEDTAASVPRQKRDTERGCANIFANTRGALR